MDLCSVLNSLWLLCNNSILIYCNYFTYLTCLFDSDMSLVLHWNFICIKMKGEQSATCSQLTTLQLTP